ncbi:MAG: hypothetical protein HW421_481 [Ignavibacteria bacterium]|nr:hypothetical protein [Ignavibacteria bacterium]
MGNGISFDTLAYTKKLKSVGFSEEQAETQVEILKSIMEDRLATKEDILDLKRDIKELELRMIIKLGALLAMSIAIVAVLVKLL